MTTDSTEAGLLDDHDGRRIGEHRADHLRVSECRFPAEHSERRHAHDRPRIMAVLGGTLCEDAGGHCHVGGVGSVAVKPAGLMHADTFGTEGLHTVTLEFDHRLFDSEIVADSAMGSYRWLTGGPMFEELATLASELQLSTVDSDAVVESKAMAILDLLAGVKTQRSSAAPRWLSEAEAYLRANSHRAISVRAVAEDVGVHHAHLHRVFRRQHRCTIGEFVRRLRVERAAELLQDGKSPMAKVALDCGFSDQPHMTRLFRRWVGVTPGAYRRALGQRETP